MEYFETLMSPTFVVTVLSAVAAFATIIVMAFPLLVADKFTDRMEYVATEREKLRAERMRSMAENGKKTSLRKSPKGYMQQIVELFNLKHILNVEETKMKLKMAGLRGQAPMVTFMFFKMATPAVLFSFSMLYFFILNPTAHAPGMKLAFSLGGAFIGFYLPTLFLTNIVQKRQISISRAFPDALDLMLICVQSGMSIEAAFAKVSKEVSVNSLELAEELTLTTAELSYLQNRRQALENFGLRTGIAQVKSVATSLIQAERYGTPVGQALRVLAQESRDERMANAEKKAASLPPKLTVPMIVFFLPVIFVVILGPSVMKIMAI